MVEGDARSYAEKLALTTYRIRFRQNRQVQEVSYARYSKELAESLAGLSSGLNDLLVGLYRIKVEPEGVEIFQEKETGSALMGSICVNHEAPRQFRFQYMDVEGLKAEEKFFLDPDGPDSCLFYKTVVQPGFTADELANHVVATELQIVDMSIQYQLRQRLDMI